MRKKTIVLVATSVAVMFAIAAYAALPPRSVEPNTVPTGTLLGQTSIHVLSVDAFLSAMSLEHGTNAVLQHLTSEPGQSTLWHKHPGPNIVMVASGSVTLTDERCHATTYYPGQGFATGLKNHLAVAGPDGVDYYSFFFLPGKADVLRTPPAGESLDPPKCAQR